MANTVAEIEAQRAKILEEIESRVGKIPQNHNHDAQPSLTEWLSAAESVMPGSQNTQASLASNNGSNALHASATSNTVLQQNQSKNFFKIIILFTFILTFIGMSFITLTYNKEAVLAYFQSEETITPATAKAQTEQVASEISAKNDPVSTPVNVEKSTPVAQTVPQKADPLMMTEHTDMQALIMDLKNEIKTLEGKMHVAQADLSKEMLNAFNRAFEEQKTQTKFNHDEQLKMASVNQAKVENTYYFELESQ